MMFLSQTLMMTMTWKLLLVFTVVMELGTIMRKKKKVRSMGCCLTPVGQHEEAGSNYEVCSIKPGDEPEPWSRVLGREDEFRFGAW